MQACQPHWSIIYRDIELLAEVKGSLHMKISHSFYLINKNSFIEINMRNFVEFQCYCPDWPHRRAGATIRKPWGGLQTNFHEHVCLRSTGLEKKTCVLGSLVWVRLLKVGPFAMEAIERLEKKGGTLWDRLQIAQESLCLSWYDAQILRWHIRDMPWIGQGHEFYY